MRKYALQLFSSMQHDVEICKQKNLDEEKEIECCYQVCTHYWQQLQRALTIYKFKNDDEEIDFFKNLKPMFTAEIEYYNLVYHSQLFKPMYDVEELEKFWLRELLRLERYTETHPGFYQYWRNKNTGNDQMYFLRKNNHVIDFPEVNMHVREQKTATSHDHILSTFMALEKYTQYVQVQIDNLKQPVHHGNN